MFTYFTYLVDLVLFFVRNKVFWFQLKKGSTSLLDSTAVTDVKFLLSGLQS